MNESTMREEWWAQQDKDDEWIKHQEEELRAYVEESESPVLADGFEDALIGFGYQFNRKLAIYDYARCVEILEGGMTTEDAVEYMEYNVIGAYVGSNTPVFLTTRAPKSKAKGRAKIDEVKQLALDFGGEA